GKQQRGPQPAATLGEEEERRRGEEGSGQLLLVDGKEEGAPASWEEEDAEEKEEGRRRSAATYRRRSSADLDAAIRRITRQGMTRGTSQMKTARFREFGGRIEGFQKDGSFARFMGYSPPARGWPEETMDQSGKPQKISDPYSNYRQFSD
ncbi:hypothetical protein LINGRAHAP2_LOCUS5007, partial [Linum grandiflorum]